MNIVGRNVIIEFAQRHPNAKSALNRWYHLMHQETFNSFVDLRKVFPYTDQVKVRRNRFNPQDKIWTVFNIGGNNFRLIASIQYNISRGVVKNLLKRYESAIFDHTTAIDMVPTFAEAYLHRGMVRGKLGDINGAESDLQTALKLAKQHGQAILKASIETGLQQLDIVGKKITSE